LKYHDGYIEAGLTPHFYPPKEQVFCKPDDTFTSPGTYRYTEMLDSDNNYMMWDTKLNEKVDKVFPLD